MRDDSRWPEIFGEILFLLIVTAITYAACGKEAAVTVLESM